MMKKLLAVVLSLALGVSLVTPVVAREETEPAQTLQSLLQSLQTLYDNDQAETAGEALACLTGEADAEWPEAIERPKLEEEALALTLADVFTQAQLAALDQEVTQEERTFPPEQDPTEDPAPEEPAPEEPSPAEPTPEEPTDPEAPAEPAPPADSETLAQEVEAPAEPTEVQLLAADEATTKETNALTVQDFFAILYARQTAGDLDGVQAILKAATTEDPQPEPTPEDPEQPQEPTEPGESETPEGPVEEPWEPGAINFIEVAPLLMLSRMPTANEDPAGRVDNPGVVTSKTATANTDGSYTLRLESYVTGASTTTTVTEQVPTDIVLVLDQSGSMKDTFSTGTKLAALKSAVTTFANNVAEQAKGRDGQYGTEDDVNHRIAVVGFASETIYKGTNYNYGNTEVFIGSDQYKCGEAAQGQYGNAFQAMNTEEGLKKVLASKDALDADGGTFTNLGMEMANGIFKANPISSNEKRNRVVIVFTDGEPGWDGYSSNVANDAISQGNTAKNNYGATVYTVGIFSGADATSAGNKRGNNIAKANWFMQNLSSNNGRVQTPSYYLSAGDSDSLNQIFASISESIESGGASVTLDQNTVIKDVVTPAFTMPENADDVTLYTAESDGSTSHWKAKTLFTDGSVQIDPDSSTVSVSGFSFQDNWCGTHTENGTESFHNGKKLIIEFTVRTKDGFLGGNNVPTNAASSGIYEQGTTLVENFEVPTVNVPINPITVTAQDKNLYLTGSLTDTQAQARAAAQCGNVDLLAGLEDWQKEFVKVSITATATTGLENLMEDTDYTLDVSVTPKETANSGSVGIAAKEQIGSDKAHIVVFKPTVTWQDTTIELGETANYADNLVSVKWYHEDEEAVPANMVGTAPELTYSYTPEASSFREDTNVSVTVDKIGNVTITNNADVTFDWRESRNCDCTTAPQDAQFRVHVNIPKFNLTITKTISNESAPDQDFVFTVTGKEDGARTYTVVIRKEQFNNGSATTQIRDLPNGEYTVTEETSWSWRYTLVGDISLQVSNQSANAVFTNQRSNNSWLSGSSSAVNNWLTTKGLTEGGSAS